MKKLEQKIGKKYRISKSVIDGCAEGKYKNYISLGGCCHIAGNLEKLGLRSCSMPYDWNTTEWRTIEETIKSQFSNYLVKKNLYQYKDCPYVYENCEAGVAFVHDFVDYLPLELQFGTVKRKYKKRISRFYKCIKNPSLFVRYCNDIDEVITINEKYDEILALFKQYNRFNEIIFITHNSIDWSIIKKIENIFIINRKENEIVSENPILQCEILNSILGSAVFDKKEENLEFYMRKKNSKLIINTKKKLKDRLIKRIFKQNKYIHSKQI